ncbi:MAG: hypothetical protein N4A33_04600 [Bacteriovoracaceae bacterium]|jgi:histone H3/H4|nr:hypothetical protein [Bacteriovoracaceae bacterium]
MENIIVLSKVKKYVKDNHGLSLGSNFVAPLNQELISSIDFAIEHAKKNNRKTVMGRDFNFYVHEPKVEAILVTASKLKAYIKEKAGMSTSKQCLEQLSVRIHKIIENSSQNTISDKRKTILDRDFAPPTHL